MKGGKFGSFAPGIRFATKVVSVEFRPMYTEFKARTKDVAFSQARSRTGRCKKVNVDCAQLQLSQL